MWKYYVTYFVIVVTSERKEFKSEDLTWGNGKPVVSYYYEIKSDSTKNTHHFNKRGDAIRHIDACKNKTVLLDGLQDQPIVYISGLKLDSIKVKK